MRSHLARALVSVSLLLPAAAAAESSLELTRSICIATTKDCFPVLRKGAPLPASYSHTFTNAVDNQRLVQVQLFEMDEAGQKAGRRIGSFDVPITPAPAGKGSGQVTITVDQTRKLMLYAKTPGRNEPVEVFGGYVAATPVTLERAPLSGSEQRGKDTHADLSVTHAQLEAGRVIVVQLPGGKPIQVKLAPVMAGTTLRIKGQARGGEGDLYLRVVVH